MAQACASVHPTRRHVPVARRLGIATGAAIAGFYLGTPLPGETDWHWALRGESFRLYSFPRISAAGEANAGRLNGEGLGLALIYEHPAWRGVISAGGGRMSSSAGEFHSLPRRYYYNQVSTEGLAHLYQSGGSRLSVRLGFSQILPGEDFRNDQPALPGPMGWLALGFQTEVSWPEI